MKLKELLSESTVDKAEIKRIHSIVREWRSHKNTGFYKDKSFGNYSIEPEGVVHKSAELIIHDYMVDENGELPFKFYSANAIDVAVLDRTKLKSFKNFPEKIIRTRKLNMFTSDLECAWLNESITSLEGITKSFYGSVNFRKFKNLSFSKIHKHIDRVSKYLYGPDDYTGPILGVLLIPEGKFEFYTYKSVEKNEKCEIVSQIINRHLKKGKDINDCQEDLIDAGLKEYAKL